MYSGRRVNPLLQEIGVAEANGEVRFLTGSSQVGVSAHAQWKIGPKLAYCVVKSPQFEPLYGHSQLLNTTVFKPDINLILSANCNKTANMNVKT